MNWNSEMYQKAVNRLIKDYEYSTAAARRSVMYYMDGDKPTRAFEDAVLVVCSNVEAGR